MPLNKITKIIGIIIAVFCVAYSLHAAILGLLNITSQYSLFNVYLFHAILSLIICCGMILIANLSTKYRDQLGFLYLFTMVFKIVFFSVVFSKVLFSDIVLNKIDSFSLLVPIFVFLTVEVVIISKILKNIQAK